MRGLIKTVAVALACGVLLCACSHKEYASDIGCRELCYLVINDMKGDKEYAEYGDEFLRYELGENAQGAKDICIVYSVGVEDIDELGIFFAEDEDEVKDIAKDCKAYIEDMQEHKRAFISSYASNELPKLDKAEVRIYGNYVVYSILNRNEAENIYNKIEERLTLR